MIIVPKRRAREARWLELTRITLPALAAERGWPIRADHCFMRVLLDNACGGQWTEHIAGRLTVMRPTRCLCGPSPWERRRLPAMRICEG